VNTEETSFPMPAPGSPLDTATTAMRHWTDGAADGDWSRLVAMLDEDVVFHVPVFGFEGVRHGVAAAIAFFDHLAAVLRADLTVTSTLRDGARIGFEVSVRGVMQDRRFVQALCLVFLISGGRVTAFHEYLAWPGGLDPAAPG
jgi:ketosteroid isomerase-like protein